MVALRYICGFFLQILPYAFFCIYPFRNRFGIERKKMVFIVLSVMTVLVIPFCLIGQFNVGGDYEEFLCNIVFYIALIFFLVLYMVSFRAAISEKLFVFFIVMSYGFLVTRLISLMCTAFDLMIDKFMYPPKALLLILLINLISAKPIMLLMERVRMMVDAKLEKRIWRLLCLIPVLFVPLTSGAYFSEIAYLGTDFLIPIYSILFTLFAFIVYAVIFRVMAYVCRQQEEYRASELMLEGYRSQAENNEKIHEIHHEIKHHLSALSAYLAQKDYNGAEQYLKKFAEDAEQLPSETYTAHPLINSILSGFAKRAQKDGTRTDFSIIVDCKLNIDDVDLCRILANILENALEAVKKWQRSNALSG